MKLMIRDGQNDYKRSTGGLELKTKEYDSTYLQQFIRDYGDRQ